LSLWEFMQTDMQWFRLAVEARNAWAEGRRMARETQAAMQQATAALRR